jgi:hypothetical protein
LSIFKIGNELSKSVGACVFKDVVYTALTGRKNKGLAGGEIDPSCATHFGHSKICGKLSVTDPFHDLEWVIVTKEEDVKLDNTGGCLFTQQEHKNFTLKALLCAGLQLDVSCTILGQHGTHIEV